jgi:exosome complex component MTR3
MRSYAGAIKMTCTVHGPRPLPRSASFSPNLMLLTHVKHAPFASQQGMGHVRDPIQKDLNYHLETALRGAVTEKRWPKSCIYVTVTIIECNQNGHDDNSIGTGIWYSMDILGCCITVASAALADAGVNCVDMVVGGVAALVCATPSSPPTVVLDPGPSHRNCIIAACCVAYLPSRNEVTNMWLKGQPHIGDEFYGLVQNAIQAAGGITRSLWLPS